jgi:arylsulfatase A
MEAGNYGLPMSQRFTAARLTFALLCLSPLLEAAQPNFVIIMADDLGYGDIGCYGSGKIKTPNLDALAKGGLRFTDYHSNGAVCSPTRAALMTGRYQQRSGVGGVITAARHREVGLAVSETTFADALGEAGYETAIFGKWHLGYAKEFNPVKNGFGEFRGYVSGNVDFFSHIDQEGYEDWWKNDALHPEEGYTTHLITRHGVRFIKEHKDKPFCLYLPYEPPHYPYQGPGDKAQREKGNKKGKIVGGRSDIAAIYREMVEEMDKGIGEILATLRENGLTENTLVFFCSDNGANSKGSNGSLKGHKGQIWEGGHRVPAIASWPGKIEAGTETDTTVLSMDLFPTMLDAAGIAAMPKLDGVSLLPLMTERKPLAERTVFWAIGKGKDSAARRGPWKFVVSGGNDKGGQLYDLSKDAGEETPVANPETEAELRKSLEKWKASWAGVPQHS